MRNVRREVKAGVGILVVILVAILTLPPGAHLGALHTGAAPAPRPATHVAAAAGLRAGLPFQATRLGPLPSKAYAVTPPTAIGAVNPGDVLVVNPSTETMYSVSYAGVITESSALTGANPSTHYVFGADNNRYVAGAGLDPVTGELYLSIIVYGPASTPNYIWAVNGQTFAVDANVTNFHGAVDFAPVGIYYEAGSGRLLVLNSSDYYGGTTFTAVVLDPSTSRILYVWNVTCGLYSCDTQWGGVTDVAPEKMFIVTADSNLTYMFNLGNFTWFVYNLLGFTTAGPTGYDPATGAFLISNLSSPSEVVEATITGFYPFSGYAVNASSPIGTLDAINWDPVDHYFVLSGQNYTSGLTELVAVNATGADLGTFTESATAGLGYVRAATIWDDAGSETLVVISWYSNQTCRVSLASTSPLIRLVQNYTQYPDGTDGMGIDPTLGLVVEGTTTAPAVRAFSVATGAPVWTDYQAATLGVYNLAVDPMLGTTYVSHGSGGIEVLSTATGARVGSFHVPEGAGELILDPARGELFAEWTTNGSLNFTMFHLAGNSGTFGGNVTFGLPSYCGFTIDSGTDRFWESTCSGAAESFNETTLAYVATLTAPGLWMYNLASDGQGHLFIENNSQANAEQIAVYDELTGRWGPNISIGSLAPGGYVADVADHLVWVEDGAASVQAFDYTTGNLAATVTLPDTWWWDSWPDSVAWDPSTSTLAVSGGLSGVELITTVPPPTAPSSLQATAGNASAHLAWTASAGSGGYPVVNYTIWQGSSASGPWTSVGSSAGPSFNATGLTNGNAYYFEVAAVSGAGTSSLSNVATATPVTVPYPVTTPTVQPKSSSSIAVSWAAPSADGGSAILGYSLEYATAATGPWTTVSLGVVLNDALTGLSAATTYYLRVAARNAVGTGNFGGAASGTTPSGSGSSPSGGGSSFPLLWAAVVGVVAIAAIVAAIAILRSRRSRGPPGSTSPPPADDSPPPGALSGSPPPPASPPMGGS